MGDFNWITPQFLAFASPQHKPIAPLPPTSPEYAALPTNVRDVAASNLPGPFKNILCHFKERNIGLVVRLNSELYSPSHFTALGIQHLDMIFDDGTCPSMPMVKKFIRLAHDMINNKKKGIAVHCKAGLGRTGCLIGAYLIYRHGFTANELISFMRFMRPGMVVGPQQHWLHMNQGTFRQWWWEDSYKEKLALMMPTTPSRSRHRVVQSAQIATPPNGNAGSKRAALGEIDRNEASAAGAMDDNLPAPTPGQPRKTSRMGSPVRPFGRNRQGTFDIATDEGMPGDEIVEVHTHRTSHGQRDDESEEEWNLRRIARRTSSKSPNASADKPRAVSSCTTTTTTTMTHYSTATDADGDASADGGIMSDVENWGPPHNHHHHHYPHDPVYPSDEKPVQPSRPKTPGSMKSGSGSGTIALNKVRSATASAGVPNTSSRRSADAREAKAAAANGVRKTSGRVGSVGAAVLSRARS